MPVNLNAFRGPDLAQIDRAAYSNALLKNERARIPQMNRMQDLAIEADQQTLKMREQAMSAASMNQTEAQRKNAAGILANQFAAIAQSSNPIVLGRQMLGNPNFAAAGKLAGLPVEQFQITDGDDPEQLRASARDWARALGGVASRLENTDIPSNVRVAEYYASLPADGPGITRRMFDEANRAPTIREIGGVQTAVGPGLRTTPLGTLDAEVDAASKVSGAEAGSRESQQRFSQQISEAYDAARGLPIAYRGLELLDTVQTGMPEAAKLAITNAFGVTGADEGELSANLGKAVLSQLRATFGAQFTEKEGERLASIEAGFGRSTEVNKRLLQQAIEIQERAIRRGIAAAREAGQTFDAGELESALQYRFRYSATGGGDIEALLNKYAPR